MSARSQLPTSPTLPVWELSISLARGTTAPPPGVNLFAHVVGGPNDLLVWLESQLGLHAPSDSAQRLAAINAAAAAAVAQFGSALAISNPYSDHPYAVVGRLLEHRDSFLMAAPVRITDSGEGATEAPVPCIDTCGFAAAQVASLPELLQEYAAVMGAATTDQRRAVASAEPDRLARVFEALADGQRLPACRITIADDRAEWPGRWRHLLETVSKSDKECVVVWSTTVSPPNANPGSALHTVQTAVDPSFASATVPPIAEDDSLRTVRCTSMAIASQAVAAALNGVTAEELTATVVVCEDDTCAALIDSHLHAFGLPTMGASIAAKGSDVHTLLPLVVEALATPADPRRVKELLSLSESPIPSEARWHLLRAIDDLPAVGSPKWEEALAEISTKYPNGSSLVAAVSQWIPAPASGSTNGGAFNPTSVRSAVKNLGDWAIKRAHGISDSIKTAYSGGLPDPADTAKLDIAEARRSHLQSLHAACRAFESLLATRASTSPISRTEYLQLLDTASQTVPPAPLHPESAGGPRRVRRDQPAVEVTVEIGGQTDEVRLGQTLELIDEAFEPSTESLADRRDLIAPQGGRRRGRGGVPDEFDLEQTGSGIDGDQAGAETTGDLFAEPIPAETIGETTVFERRGIDAQADERTQATVRIEVEADGDDLPDRDAIHAHRRAGGDALDGERRSEDEGDERSGPRTPPRESGPQESRDQHGQHQAAERASAHPAVWG